MILILNVNGVPVAWSRPRKRKQGGYWSPHRETAWYHDILGATKALLDHSLSGPIRMDVTFRMPRPQQAKRDTWHVKRPDRSNLLKLVEDAMQDAKIISDDSIFCAGDVVKRYVRGDETPGAEIRLEALA